MNKEDKEFIKSYRAVNDSDLGIRQPPCLKCSDELIIECSTNEIKPHNPKGNQMQNNTMGCSLFKSYVSNGGKT